MSAKKNNQKNEKEKVKSSKTVKENVIKEKNETVKLDENLDIVEDSVLLTNNNEVTLEDAINSISGVDTSIETFSGEDDTIDEELTKETEKTNDLIKEVNEINDNFEESVKSFNEKFESVNTKEDAEKLINEEIKKTQNEQQKIEKIIKHSNRPKTNSWNGISVY